MKKFLAMILSIMLLALPCAGLADADAAAETNADAAAETDADAVAETDAAGEAIEFTYDPDVIAQAGLEGEFVSLADMGILFQFFLPNTLTAQDLTEDQAATGAIALFVNEDATNSMSIGYGMAVDAEGNTVTTLEELNAAYASAGCEDMEYATINGIPCMQLLHQGQRRGRRSLPVRRRHPAHLQLLPRFRRKLRRGYLRYPLLYHAR